MAQVASAAPVSTAADPLSMPSTVTSYLFAYGTLRRGAREPARELLAGHAMFVGMGWIRAKLYDLGAYPGAVPSEQPTDRVYGEIHRLRQAAAVFKRLDQYEGEHFKRQQVSVSVSTGKKISAWVYLYRGPVKETKRIPSGDYLAFSQIR
jgi:gamma-glutamylcyclotransferase (GGCT)/AIG2-like uncharacterized protein YtfP